MQQLQSLLGGGVVSNGEGATYQNSPQQLLQIHPQLLQVSACKVICNTVLHYTTAAFNGNKQVYTVYTLGMVRMFASASPYAEHPHHLLRNICIG